MNKGRIMLFAMLAAATIVIAVLMSIFATGATGERPEIVLPQELPRDFSPDGALTARTVRRTRET